MVCRVFVAGCGMCVLDSSIVVMGRLRERAESLHMLGSRPTLLAGDDSSSKTRRQVKQRCAVR